MERDDARGDQPRNTRPRGRAGWDQATENLSSAEWRALLSDAERGRLEDVDA